MGHLIAGLFCIFIGILNLYFWHDLEMRKDKKEALPTITTYKGILKGEYIETYNHNGKRFARYYRDGKVYFASDFYYQGDDK